MQAVVEMDDLDISIGEEDAREIARTTYLAFVKYTFPEYKINWHHIILAEALDRFANGLCKRLIIVLPPQAGGKSELVSRKLPAYILGKFPDSYVIQASHTDKLAMKMTRAVKKTMLSREYHELFPDSRLRSNARGMDTTGYIQTAHEFEVVGHKGSLLSTGAAGSISGNPGGFAICDDLIRNVKSANSITQREDVWEWFESELRHRVGAAGSICITGTRFHEDDIIGRIIKAQSPNAEGKIDPDAEQWEIIHLPARFEIDKDPLYPVHPLDPRKKGDPLWTWYYGGKRDDLPESEQFKRAQKFLRAWEHRNERDFATMAQGRPKPREGVLIKWAWWQTVPVVPLGTRMIRYWDLAGTAKDLKRASHDPDFCAGALMTRMHDKRVAVCDMAHFRMDVGARDVELLRIAQDDLDKYGDRGIKWWIETEGGIGGALRMQNLIKELQALGISVEADPIPDTSKLLRADPMISQIKAGNFVLLEGYWNGKVKAEAAAFTGEGETHDDMIDAMSGGLSKLSGEDDGEEIFLAQADG